MVKVASAQRFEAKIFIYLPNSIKNQTIVNVFLKLVQIIYQCITTIGRIFAVIRNMTMLDLKMCELKVVKRFDIHNFAEKQNEVISLDIIVKSDCNRRFFYMFVFTDVINYLKHYFAHYILRGVTSKLSEMYIESNLTDCDYSLRTNSFLFKAYFCLSCDYFRFTCSSYLNIFR